MEDANNARPHDEVTGEGVAQIVEPKRRYFRRFNSPVEQSSQGNDRNFKDQTGFLGTEGQEQTRELRTNRNLPQLS